MIRRDERERRSARSHNTHTNAYYWRAYIRARDIAASLKAIVSVEADGPGAENKDSGACIAPRATKTRGYEKVDTPTEEGGRGWEGAGEEVESSRDKVWERARQNSSPSSPRRHREGADVESAGTEER